MSDIKFSFEIKEYNSDRDFVLVYIQCDRFENPKLARSFTINTLGLTLEQDIYEQIKQNCLNIVITELNREDAARKAQLTSFVEKNKNIVFTKITETSNDKQEISQLPEIDHLNSTADLFVVL